jgi:hypothetical protein
MRLSLFALLFVVPAALAADVEPKDKKVVAREIKVAGLPAVRGALKDPVKITSKEELEKAVTDKYAVEKILKEVDLKKEFLLLFQWAGSGQDKLEMKEEKGTVTFSYVRGRTRDLRSHVKLFALPNKTEYKLAK